MIANMQGNSRMPRTFALALAAVGGVLILLFSSAYTVHQTQQALIVQFGKPVAVVQKPGLNFKIPFIQKVTMFDNRLLELNAEQKEVTAADKKRLVVDAFLRYRITDPLRFFQAVRNEAVMRDRLNTNLESALRSVISTVPLSALVSSARPKVMRDIRDLLNRQMSNAEVQATVPGDEAEEAKGNAAGLGRGFGIEIVDVRIMRADLPTENREAVFARMKTEREREAKDLRAKGDEDAQKIRSKAEKERTILLAEAQKEAEITRGQGDAKASKIFADAAGNDPEFYSFYRSLQAYRKTLSSKDTTVILSPGSAFLHEFEGGK